jgi:putative Ca2+/H+ antiporter (TMEM165/GDT1 family)
MYWQAFTLTFFGEWGDRSQFSRIALSAQENALTVLIGATLVQVSCMAIAVLAGRLISEKVSERMMKIVGGNLFLIYG